MNYRKNLPKGTGKSVRIIAIFELQRFKLEEEIYKSFSGKLHGDFKFLRIMEIFKQRRFELERVDCIFKTLPNW